MKTLNLFPIYRFLVETCLKRASVRLGEKYARKLKPGNHVRLTLGWTEEKAVPIADVIITHILKKKLRHVSIWDLVGESPNCSEPRVLPYVLGMIYRKVVEPDNWVTIIYWRYV